jgi:hypothetical protein
MHLISFVVFNYYNLFFEVSYGKVIYCIECNLT